MSVELSQLPAFKEAVASRGREPADKAHKEEFSPDPWVAFSLPLGSYLWDYRELFDPADEVAGRLALGALAEQSEFKTVLDIGADTRVVNELVREYGYRKGVAVSLGRANLLTFPDLDTERIAGDLLPTERSGSAFLQVQSYLDRNGLNGFDLVLSRMMVGTSPGFLTDDLIVHAWLLEQVWRCMNSEGSLALLQLPIMYDSTVNYHQGRRPLDLMLQRLRGAGIYCSRTGNSSFFPAIRVERNSVSPDSIAPIIAPHLFVAEAQSAVPTR